MAVKRGVKDKAARKRKREANQANNNKLASSSGVPKPDVANGRQSVEKPKRIIDNLPRKQTDRLRLAKSRQHRSNHHDNFLPSLSFDHSVLNSKWLQLLSVGLLVAILASIVGRAVIDWKASQSIITPIDLPKVIDHTGSKVDWGTYRPGFYFGLRHRDPSSPLIGLIWFAQTGQMPKFRHKCDSGDGLISFNWIEHDGRDFGVEQIVDTWHIITVAFLKQDDNQWNVRVSAVSRNQSNTPPLSVIVYVYYPDSASARTLAPLVGGEGSQIDGLRGSTPVLGNHQFAFTQSQSSIQSSRYLAHIPNETQIMDSMLNGLRMYRDSKLLTLANEAATDQDGPVNALFFETTFQTENKKADGWLDVMSDTDNTVLDLTYSTSKTSDKKSQFDLTRLRELSRRFHERFVQRFPTEGDKHQFSNRQIELGRIALSNLLGGIGYFHGQSLIQPRPGVGLMANLMPTSNDPLEGFVSSLLSTTPSRTLFPRGFLWDEGFHSLAVARWCPELAMRLVGHWLDLANTDGWIGREQILGEEARSRVPKEFIVQSTEVANPPTFSLLIEALMDELPNFTSSETSHFRQWALAAFPRLHAWYQWFNNTQSGPLSYSYRWRGRNPHEKHQLNPLTLSSGLDDYPRASHPSQDERHLDLLCWMTHFARQLSRLGALIAQYRQTESGIQSPDRLYRLGISQSLTASYSNWADKLSDSLDALHWSEDANRYADYGLHSDEVELVQPPPVENNNGRGSQSSPPPKPVRSTLKPPSLQLVTSQFGYVNLFPLLLRIIPPSSPRLDSLIRDLANRQLLWTDHGLRSLSNSSRFYAVGNTRDDPPYWRGAIWININYLAVKSLRHYASSLTTSGPTRRLAEQLASNLTTNLIHTVLGNLDRTGYLWEQYNDKTGKGQRGHPFSGWTSLIALIMSSS